MLIEWFANDCRKNFTSRSSRRQMDKCLLRIGNKLMEPVLRLSDTWETLTGVIHAKTEYCCQDEKVRKLEYLTRKTHKLCQARENTLTVPGAGKHINCASAGKLVNCAKRGKTNVTRPPAVSFACDNCSRVPFFQVLKQEYGCTWMK